MEVTTTMSIQLTAAIMAELINNQKKMREWDEKYPMLAEIALERLEPERSVTPPPRTNTPTCPDAPRRSWERKMDE